MSRPVAGLLLCGLFVSLPAVAEELNQVAPIQPSHGYLLIRIAGASGERIERFEFTNQETGYVVTMRTDVCKPAGPRARMCIVISPPGRYFWSKYEVEYRIGIEPSQNQDPPIIRETPGSASDTFEIAPGVINYIGDWEMRISAGDVRSSGTRRWSVDIRQNTKTLGRLFEEFPDYSNRYEIYLSMMGREAISLREFLSIVQEHSE
jgi:hypothetical protein